MEFLIGVGLGLTNSYLSLIGVPLSSLVGTLFLLLMFPAPIAIGYWATSQALIFINITGELFYVEDKELDDTSAIKGAREAKDLYYIVDYILHAEGFVTCVKASMIIFIVLDPTFFGSNPVFSTIIKTLSFIMAFILIICMFNRYKYESKETIFKYMLGAFSIILLFNIMQKANIGALNSIPLLLSVVFLDMPLLYGRKEKRLKPQLKTDGFHWESYKIDYGYLLIVFICNLGIGTSKLANFIQPDETCDTNEAINLCLGKSVSAFVSSSLWVLFASTRSALEDTVSYIDLSELKEYGLAVAFVIITVFITAYNNKDWIIKQAENPLNNISKTIINTTILFLMVAFSLHGQFNIITCVILFTMGILINYFVNKSNIPNSSLSFITTYVPISGMIF